MNFKMRNMKGFTLVELLIVIGILAVLTAVVIIALNPLQNIAKTKDAGRLNTVTQLGHALEAYATANSGNYVDLTDTCANAGDTWISCLTSAGSGDINTVPAAVAYSGSITACNLGGAAESGVQSVQNDWCYKSAAAGAAPIIVYARAEATANNSKCPAATPVAWFAYLSAEGRAGITCTNAVGVEPGTGATLVP